MPSSSRSLRTATFDIVGRWGGEEFVAVVANVRAAEADDGTVKSRCRFIAYRNRTETETDFFVGKRHDILRRDAATGFKIAAREIFLDQNVLLAKNLTIFF